MSNMPGTVGVNCPRCDETVECTVHAEPIAPKPGARSVTMRLTVPDLAEKMAAHYTERHAQVDAVQAAVVESVNALGSTLIGSGYEPITTSPISDDDMAQIVDSAMSPIYTDSMLGFMP